MDGFESSGGGFWFVGWDPYSGSFFGDLVNPYTDETMREVGAYWVFDNHPGLGALTTIDALESELGEPIPLPTRTRLESAGTLAHTRARIDNFANLKQLGLPTRRDHGRDLSP